MFDEARNTAKVKRVDHLTLAQETESKAHSHGTTTESSLEDNDGGVTNSDLGRASSETGGDDQGQGEQR